ncbi:MAG: hypothetical protein LBK97_03250 [Prevotellaceae bacterium]|jgi:hypothetical protein|nr:hypothetical protein [Prevotellaceae bacterium]
MKKTCFIILLVLISTAPVFSQRLKELIIEGDNSPQAFYKGQGCTAEDGVLVFYSAITNLEFDMPNSRSRLIKIAPYDRRYNCYVLCVQPTDTQIGGIARYSLSITAEGYKPVPVFYVSNVKAAVTQYFSVNGKKVKKGYIGLGVGLSTLLAEYTDIESNGLQFNVNAGYLIGNNVGITASFLFTSYTTDYDAKTGLTGGFIGPLISFSNSLQKVEYDIRPTIGFVSGKIKGSNVSFKTENMALAVGVGGSIRWNVSNLISLTGNLDTYFHGEFKESDVFTLEPLSSVGISAGINFRF